MKPFKVTIRFSAPLVLSDYPVHLDALLAWCYANEAEEGGAENPWEMSSDLSPGLARAEGEGGQWCWKASRVLFTPSSEKHLMNMLRRTDPEKFQEDYDKGHYTSVRGPKGSVNSIDSNSGQYRAYQMYISYQWMEKAEAYGVGDIDTVKEWLDRLSSVGKLGRNGFGTIASIEVEECSAAESLWRNRVLPQGVEGVDGITYAPVMATLHPPYWNQQDREMVMEPVS